MHGLKPALILGFLHGAEAPLFHGTTRFIAALKALRHTNSIAD
jgi:hypothetical protein